MTEIDSQSTNVLTSKPFCLLLLNAVLGVALFERTWKSTERFRNSNKELDQLFPAFRRDDAHRWARWQFYPGAVFLLIPRVIWVILMFMLNVLLCRIFTLGHDHTKPYKGVRKFLVNMGYYLTARSIGVLCYTTWNTYKYLNPEECDYSEYLGTKEPQEIGQSLGA